MPSKKRQPSELRIRNSTAEFLVFSYQAGGDGVEVCVQDGTVWLSQKNMELLLDTSSDNIGLHLKNIFKDEELLPDSVTEEFSVAAADGKIYNVKHYNLDAIIAVGYRVNSKRATAFRQWATGVLRDYTLRGYVLDKMHYAVHQHTAAELIYERADADKEHMGLTNWASSPSGRIVKSDVSIAKNYLTEAELHNLSLLVNAYLDLAERRAKNRTPMTMENWAKHLDLILQADGNELLTNAGKISAEIAKAHAENEFEKYRVIQDKFFESDFDKQLKMLEQ